METEGDSMTQPGKAPPGWAKLCAMAQKEKDPEKFKALIERINRLLDRYEKRHPLPPD
jgi:hypothetical protein